MRGPLARHGRDCSDILPPDHIAGGERLGGGMGKGSSLVRTGKAACLDEGRRRVIPERVDH